MMRHLQRSMHSFAIYLVMACGMGMLGGLALPNSPIAEMECEDVELEAISGAHLRRESRSKPLTHQEATSCQFIWRLRRNSPASFEVPSDLRNRNGFGGPLVC